MWVGAGAYGRAFADAAGDGASERGGSTGAEAEEGSALSLNDELLASAFIPPGSSTEPAIGVFLMRAKFRGGGRGSLTGMKRPLLLLPTGM